MQAGTCSLVCGHFGLWPFCLRSFWLWPFRFVAVMTCYYQHSEQVNTTLDWLLLNADQITHAESTPDPDIYSPCASHLCILWVDHILMMEPFCILYCWLYPDLSLHNSCTCRCHQRLQPGPPNYNAVSLNMTNILRNTDKRIPMSCPWRDATACLLWVLPHCCYHYSETCL